MWVLFLMGKFLKEDMTNPPVNILPGKCHNVVLVGLESAGFKESCNLVTKPPPACCGTSLECTLKSCVDRI